jgi:hypothetical protein
MLAKSEFRIDGQRASWPLSLADFSDVQVLGKAPRWAWGAAEEG